MIVVKHYCTNLKNGECVNNRAQEFRSKKNTASPSPSEGIPDRQIQKVLYGNLKSKE